MDARTINTKQIKVMNEGMTTATEWLFNQLWDTPKDKLTWYALLEQAKEMEKQQIIDAASDHCYPTCELARKDAEQYYNETYNIISGK